MACDGLPPATSFLLFGACFQPGIKLGFFFFFFSGGAFLCSHQCPQHRSSSSVPLLGPCLFTLSPLEISAVRQQGLDLHSCPPPAAALLSLTRCSHLLALPPRPSCGPSAPTMKVNGEQAHPTNAQAQIPSHAYLLALFSHPMWQPPENPPDPSSRKIQNLTRLTGSAATTQSC